MGDVYGNVDDGFGGGVGYDTGDIADGGVGDWLDDDVDCLGTEHVINGAAGVHDDGVGNDVEYLGASDVGDVDGVGG